MLLYLLWWRRRNLEIAFWVRSFDLTSELLQKGSSSVKRTASNCLGSLSGFLGRERLVSIDDKIFKGISSKDLKNTIIRVQTLALLKRNSGARLGTQIPTQTGFYIKQL